jgi:hypothetical protein
MQQTEREGIPSSTFAERVVDVELESSGGGRRRLSDHRGRVVVLFWEDRESNQANAAAKKDLDRITAAVGGELVVVAVGDVSAFDFPGARSVVRTAIRTMAKAIGVEILLDWKGALASPPFGLQPGTSNVMVLDRQGRPAFRHRGELSAERRRELLERVRGLIGPVASRAA